MLGKKLIKSNDAGVCTSDEADIFGDSSGVALYQLNLDGSDMSGNYDGVATDVSFVNGHIDSAGSFNGSTSRITTSLDFDTIDEEWAVSMWVKFTFDANHRYFAGSYDSGPANGFEIATGTSGEIRFMCKKESVSLSSIISTATYGDGNWHHVVVVKGASTNILYVDGGSVGSTATTNGIPHNGFVIGSAGNYLVKLTNGDIDQVRIFNKAISASEVSTLYAEAACAKTCTTDTPQIVPDCMAYYKLDGNATDSNGSGTLYDGTATNVSWTQGRFGSAGGFNGASSVISFSNSGFPSNNMCVSAWVKPSATFLANGISGIVAWGNTLAGQRRSLVYYSSGELGFSGAYAAANFTGTTVLSTGVWSHVAFTISGSTVTLYINGAFEASGTVTLNSYSSTTGFIGRTETTSTNEHFNGSIDQVKIFDRAITAAEVTTLYNEVQCPSNASFNTVLYTGNGTSGGNTLNVGGVGFTPDLVWVKNRTASINHYLYDSVRGTGAAKALHSNTTSSESTASTYTDNGGVEAITTEGFVAYRGTDNTYQGTNMSGQNYVAWCWKAGGAAVTNTDGSITSEVSANVDAGFSVVKYTGNSSASGTIGHALTAAPNVIIVKNLDNGSALWSVYSSAVGASQTGHLDTSAAFSASGDWFSTTPTSSVFSVGSSGSGRTNSTAQNHIAYCFAEKAGFSKFGSYTGNGSNTGPSITTGFEPAFVMIKRTSADASGGNWIIKDNKRNTSNPRTKSLFPNLSTAEATEYDVNFNATSFQILNADVDINKNGGTYIYMAFANQF